MSRPSLRAAPLALLLIAATERGARATDVPPAPTLPAAKLDPRRAAEPATKEPTMPRVRVAVGVEVRAGWRLGVDEAGATALLLDDGSLAWAMLEPATAWLESCEQPLTAVPPGHLAGALSHAMAPIRDRCEELLVAQGALAAPALGEALRSPSIDARRHALNALAERPAKQWSARIRERLAEDGEAPVRRAALAAYAALQPDDLTRVCCDLLRFDGDVGVRHDAIGHLGRSRDLAVVDPLFAHLDSCDERSVRLVTFDALRRLTGRRFGRDEAAWRAWWSNHRSELLPADVR